MSASAFHEPNWQGQTIGINCENALIKTRAVAVCDILGFSTLVGSKPLTFVVDQALGWLRKALYHSLHKEGFPEHTPNISDLRNHEHLGFAWFSDTLLLYTRDDSPECIQQIIQTVGWLLFETIIAGNTRLRCGISYGETFIDEENGLFVGRPIVEAYHLEKSQEWSGAALTDNATALIPERARNGEFGDWWIIPWDVPLKEGRSRRMHVVNWTWGIHNPGLFLRWSAEAAEPPAVDWEQRPDVCRKWKNTKAFHDQTCGWCNRQSRLR